MIEIYAEADDLTPVIAADVSDKAIEIARKQILYGTTAYWNSDKTRIAEKGIIYVYSDYAKTTAFGGGELDVPGIKIGDGTSYLIDMPFAQGEVNAEVISHIENQKIHVSDDDRKRWDQRELNIEISGENLTLS